MLKLQGNAIVFENGEPYATVEYPDDGVRLNVTENVLISSELSDLIEILRVIESKVDDEPVTVNLKKSESLGELSKAAVNTMVYMVLSKGEFVNTDGMDEEVGSFIDTFNNLYEEDRNNEGVQFVLNVIKDELETNNELYREKGYLDILEDTLTDLGYYRNELPDMPFYRETANIYESIKPKTITLDNQQIASSVSRLYPDDYCVIVWDSVDMKLTKFKDEDKAKEHAKYLNDADESEEDAFLFVFKNGEHINHWK